MRQRLRALGFVLALIGVGFLVGGGVAFAKTQDGYSSFQALSEAQNVTLSYNDEGQLVDRGSTEAAAEIMALLTEDWGYPVVESDLDPNDPLVNTASEYMYQMATIAYHTLTGTQTVVLTERVEVDGDGDGTVADDAPVYTGGEWDPTTAGEDAIFEPGVYQVPVANRYWTGFDRLHPLDGPAREQAWNGTVHSLFAQLGVGATTASSLEMGQGVAAIAALMGAGFLVVGGGLLWAGMARKEEQEARVEA
jgi:hypothetical protein